MRHLLVVVMAVLGVWACGRSTGGEEGGGGGAETAADTLTRRQKDSLISTMPLPGASGIGRAQEAADRARERADVHDSIG
jgi:hypothetical protein